MRSDAELREFITERKGDIGPRWQQLVLETYPPETFRFLRKKKDRFDNPIGHAVAEMVDGVLEGIVAGADAEVFRSALYPVVQIRAVQDFSPAQAMEEDGCEVLLTADAKVDELMRIAFDIYCACRERIYEIRTDEVKRNLFMLLKEKNVLDIDGQGRE
jgi:hypothetical protein